ncbi:MAG: M28 family peptidase [candidate division KSB1 bacterium]|nr:M28 family peptidase [candidate division KSB1 bacterium]
MQTRAIILCLGFFLIWGGQAQPQTAYRLLPQPILKVIAEELSGETAHRHLEFLAQHHRMRGSRQFHRVAQYIAERLREYGLEQVEILQFPADGKTFYGTQKARLAWDAEFAELWELKQTDTGWQRHKRIASWEAMPITLAQDSESGEATADLVDVGTGLSEADYRDKPVRGNLVLTSSQPGAIQHLAVDRFGAAGILSYAQNQRTAWWKENDNFVRWGHLDSFTERPTFAFMISLKQAREYRQRLERGERIRFYAVVKAQRHPGYYDVITAVIPGSDPRLRDEEIAFSCHLDHQRPGANDNASGSVAILEVARTFAKLIREGQLPKPRRTLRFIWPPEIEGTLALLNGRPEFAQRIKAVIHMDMVGGGPVTRAIFHVTRGPGSLPSFIYDVAEVFGKFVNAQTDAFASGRDTPFPLHSPEGGKEALQAVMASFSMGSDHQVYTDGSFRIPAIYLNDWPDRFIHTNFDVPANVDPSKLKRAGFIGAASAYFLANVTENEAPVLWDVLRMQALERMARTLARQSVLPTDKARLLAGYRIWYETQTFESMQRFFAIPESLRRAFTEFEQRMRQILKYEGPFPPRSRASGAVYRRSPKVKGPMSVFGYDYFRDHLGREKASRMRLLTYRGLWGAGSEYAYEALNFVDGRRTVTEIRDLVSAEYGPIPTELVEEYLQALASIGVVQKVK